MLTLRHSLSRNPWPILLLLFSVQFSWIVYWGLANKTLANGGDTAFLAGDWRNYRDFGLHFREVCHTGAFPRGERIDPSPPSPPIFNHIWAYWWPPLLPAWLALTHALGLPASALPWTVALWTSTTAPLMFLLMGLRCRPGFSLMVALATALYPGFLLRSFQMSECFSLPLLLLFFRCLFGRSSALATGLMAGLCTLARFPNGVLALFFLAGLLKRDSRRYSAMSLGMMLLMLLPWMMRNKTLLDRFTLSVNGPYLLYASNHPLIWDRPPSLTAHGSEGRGTFLSFPYVFTPASFPDKTELLGPNANPKNSGEILEILAVKPVTELTDLFQRKFLEAASTRPADLLAEIPWKIRRLMHWHLQTIPGEPFWFIPSAWLLQALGLGLIFRTGAWRRPLIVFVLTQLLVAAVFYGNDRFRTGLDLALLLAAGAALGKTDRHKPGPCPKMKE